MTRIPADIRELIVCPRCQGPLGDVMSGDDLSGLRCDACGLTYEVTGGIPVLVVDSPPSSDTGAAAG